MGFHCAVQVGLEHLGLQRHCVLTTQVAGTTGVHHHTQIIHLIFRSFPYRQKSCIDARHLNLFYNKQSEYYKSNHPTISVSPFY